MPAAPTLTSRRSKYRQTLINFQKNTGRLPKNVAAIPFPKQMPQHLRRRQNEALVDLEDDRLGGGRELEAVEELQPLCKDGAKDRACGCGARVSTRPVSACARAPRSGGVGAHTTVERYARGSGELRRERARQG